MTAGEVWHASTSGGTQAGLTLGRLLLGRGPAVRGVSAGVVWRDPATALARHASEAAAILGRAVEIAPAEIALDAAWVGAGYGEPTPAGLEAIRLLARTEGILCDPVYSGKGLAGARRRGARRATRRSDGLLAHRRRTGALRLALLRCAGTVRMNFAPVSELLSWSVARSRRIERRDRQGSVLRR